MKNTIGFLNGEAVHLGEDVWRLATSGQVIEKGILTLPAWRSLAMSGDVDRTQYGVLLEPDDDPLVLQDSISLIPIIALQFPSFRDGRAYSQASLLRTRYHFQGDLRAIGDVLRDQLILMRHCGFSSFTVREDKSVADALKGLAGFDRIYARSVTQPEPRFRQRSSGFQHGR